LETVLEVLIIYALARKPLSAQIEGRLVRLRSRHC